MAITNQEWSQGCVKAYKLLSFPCYLLGWREQQARTTQNDEHKASLMIEEPQAKIKSYH